MSLEADILASSPETMVFSFCTEDFAAHSSNVNCLALGHKSGRVLVTGGDDKKVNLWAVGKQNCIMVSTIVSYSYFCKNIIFVKTLAESSPLKFKRCLCCAIVTVLKCFHSLTDYA